jgi:cation diffusion facilitator CzcD-associated flavoprotein CzcO
MRDVIVIGAGSSGVATTVASKQGGVDPLVIDVAEGVASSWHGRCHRLRLNTGRQFSLLAISV